jgi:hypothetical protein
MPASGIDVSKGSGTACWGMSAATSTATAASTGLTAPTATVGVGTSGLLMELVVSDDGERISSMRLEVQPATTRQMDRTKGTLKRRMATRTQNNSPRRCHRPPAHERNS